MFCPFFISLLEHFRNYRDANYKHQTRGAGCHPAADCQSVWPVRSDRRGRFTIGRRLAICPASVPRQSLRRCFSRIKKNLVSDTEHPGKKTILDGNSIVIGTKTAKGE